MPGKASNGRGPGKPFKKGDKRPGRPKGALNKATRDAKDACKGIVEDKRYRANLRKRAIAGELAPAVEVMLYAYAYGKPKERMELTGPDGGPIQTQDVTREEAMAALQAALPKSDR